MRPPALRSWCADVEDNWRMCRNASSLNCHIPAPPDLLHAKSRHTTLQISRFSLGMWACCGQISAPLTTLDCATWLFILLSAREVRMLIYYKVFWAHKGLTTESIHFTKAYLMEKVFCLKHRPWASQQTFVIMATRYPLAGVRGAAMPFFSFELLSMALIHHTWGAVKMISSSCARCKIALYSSCHY
jgi:hypothetical protein